MCNDSAAPVGDGAPELSILPRQEAGGSLCDISPSTLPQSASDSMVAAGTEILDHFAGEVSRATLVRLIWEAMASASPSYRCCASNWVHNGVDTGVYPANRTKIISPTLDRKICRSLKRTARLLSFRIYFGLLLLDARKFLIEARYLGMRIFRNLYGCGLHFLNNTSRNA